MSRLRVALALLLLVFASLGGGTAIAAPVDQAGWTSLLKAFPRAEAHVFPDLGHNPNWERPELVAQAMSRFLDAR